MIKLKAFLAILIASSVVLTHGCAITTPGSSNRTNNTPDAQAAEVTDQAKQAVSPPQPRIIDPEDASEIEITCDFNIKDYIENPWGFKEDGIGGALKWVNFQVKGGLQRRPGKNLARIIEADYWGKKNTNTHSHTFYRIGSKNTSKGKHYLGVYKPPGAFTFIEIPDEFKNRVSLTSASLQKQSVNCTKPHNN